MDLQDKMDKNLEKAEGVGDEKLGEPKDALKSKKKKKKSKKSSMKKKKKTLDKKSTPPGAVAMSSHSKTTDARDKIDLEKQMDIPVAEAVPKNEDVITCTVQKKCLWWAGLVALAFLVIVLGVVFGLKGKDEEQAKSFSEPPYVSPYDPPYYDPYDDDEWEYYYPTMSPTEAPPPTEPVPVVVVPTEELCASATCHSSFEELQQALDSDAAIVAMCEDIAVDATPLSVQRDGITLVGCCEDRRCVIEGSGNTRNLVVRGDDFTLQSIAIVGGVCNAPVDGGGANLQVFSGGFFHIIDSELRGGRCGSEGGNLRVDTTGDVYMKGSRFDGGDGSIVGGAAILDARDVQIDECEFLNNLGSGLGRYLGSGSSIMVNNSFFKDNVADYSTIFVSHFGNMPRLEVLNTVFEGNTAKESSGGVTSIFIELSEFVWSGNEGTGNTGRGCNDVFIQNDGGNCYDVSAEIIIP